jgi:hypothetical protein
MVVQDRGSVGSLLAEEASTNREEPMRHFLSIVSTLTLALLISGQVVAQQPPVQSPITRTVVAAMSVLGHSLPIHSARVPNNVRYASDSDQIADMPRMTRSANSYRIAAMQRMSRGADYQHHVGE